MKVHQWTKVAESDKAPMQSSTAEGGNPKGLIKTLVASGIQANASGGWSAQETHQGHDPTDALVEQLARKTVAEDLLDMVSVLFWYHGEADDLLRRLDMTDSKVKATATLVDDIVAQVGSDKGRQLVFDRWGVLMKAKRGAVLLYRPSRRPRLRSPSSAPTTTRRVRLRGGAPRLDPAPGAGEFRTFIARQGLVLFLSAP